MKGAAREAWRTRAWKVAFFAALLALTWALLTPEPPGPDAAPFPHADKLQHAIAFALVGLLAARAYEDRPRWGVFAALVFYGACIEVAQREVGRTFDLLDLAADGLGALAVHAVRRPPRVQQRSS